MQGVSGVGFLRLRHALEASWGPDTSYGGVSKAGNPAWGQCYPTARVVQHFFPETEVVEGEVWTGEAIEAHFWNAVVLGDTVFHIDLSWSQFPAGSSVRTYDIWDRSTFGDGPEAVRRVATLLGRVTAWLDTASGDLARSTAPVVAGADPAAGVI